jgi:Peptidase C39 family
VKFFMHNIRTIFRSRRATTSRGHWVIIIIAWGSILTSISPKVHANWSAMSGGDSPTSAEDKTLVYRVPQLDGINCLYVQLKFLGYNGDYASFRAQAAAQGTADTMESLSSLARKLGFDLVPTLLTGPELGRLNQPVLIHQERNGLGSGEFCLFLERGRDQVRLVSGPSMSWVETRRDLFERDWTGYALVLRSGPTMPTKMRRAVALMLSLWTGAVILRFHTTRHLRRGTTHRPEVNS